jgi:hypothetical protein
MGFLLSKILSLRDNENPTKTKTADLLTELVRSDRNSKSEFNAVINGLVDVFLGIYSETSKVFIVIVIFLIPMRALFSFQYNGDFIIIS